MMDNELAPFAIVHGLREWNIFGVSGSSVYGPSEKLRPTRLPKFDSSALRNSQMTPCIKITVLHLHPNIGKVRRRRVRKRPSPLLADRLPWYSRRV